MSVEGQGYNPSQDGTDATGVVAPTGGWGIRGWLSGIYALLSGSKTSGTITQVTVTVGTASTLLLAAGTATSFIKVSVPLASANLVWINWTGVPAVTASPSEDLSPGTKVVWSSTGGGFLPTSNITCIASAATPITLEYK